MELHNLQPAVGSNKKKRRIGRGPGSGKGGTATRGNKGAKSRSGYINRVEYKAINISALENLATRNNLDKITIADLLQAGLVGKRQLVKVLGDGKLTKKLEVEANAFSKKAEEAIVAAGGSIAKV